MIIEETKVVTNIKEDDILLECLKVLFKTKEGECPIYRKFGLSNVFVDENVGVTQELYAQEAIDKVERYIPQLEVVQVEFKVCDDGKIFPSITVQRKEVKNGDFR